MLGNNFKAEQIQWLMSEQFAVFLLQDRQDICDLFLVIEPKVTYFITLTHTVTLHVRNSDRSLIFFPTQENL